MSRPDGINPLIDIQSDERFMALHELVDPKTMTPIEVQHALYRAVLYIHENRIPGNIVECGVWFGGSMLLAAKLLADLGDTSREIWLFDTFQGMTEPGPEDVNCVGQPGERLWKSEYLKVSLDEVKKTMALSGYPEEKIKYVVGDVRETAKDYARLAKFFISLLRLDTDFMDSTKAELQYLYPSLIRGGILILDDYLHWMGAKKAVDEYFEDEEIFLNRINYSARLAIKP